MIQEATETAVRTCDDALLRIDAAKNATDADEHEDAYVDDSPPASSPRATPLLSPRTNDAVDADLAELINLGLSLGDVERLWGGVEGVNAEAIHTAASAC